MFMTAPPGSLNYLARLGTRERMVVRRRGLSQAAEDQAQAEAQLSKFGELWSAVRGSVADMLDLPAHLQRARADLDDLRQRSLDIGAPGITAEIERLYGDVQAHEADASKVAGTIQQYLGAWRQMESYASSTWSGIGGIVGDAVSAAERAASSVGSTVGSWWLSARRASGLGVLPLLPIAYIIAAVAALGFVAVTGIAVLAWWNTTATTIDGVKRKLLPPTALGQGGPFGQALGSIATPLLWAGGIALGLTALSFIPRGRR